MILCPKIKHNDLDFVQKNDDYVSECVIGVWPVWSVWQWRMSRTVSAIMCWEQRQTSVTLTIWRVMSDSCQSLTHTTLTSFSKFTRWSWNVLFPSWMKVISENITDHNTQKLTTGHAGQACVRWQEVGVTFTQHVI